jgi:hypothetical protein
MTIQVKALGGRSGGVNTSRVQHILAYEAWDDADRWPAIDDLIASVEATAPAVFQGSAVSDVSWDEDDENGRTVFRFTYDSGEPPESLLRIAYDSTGGTVRARASKATTSYPAPGRTAPDYKNAIEVVGGEPQGVDVAIPALKMTFKYKWPKGVITLADVRQLASVTGKVNDNTWYGFAAGELLFLGVTGEIDIAVANEVEYNFVASANAELSIGSWITGIVKQGHQHLWVAFEDFEDTSANRLVRRPLAAYVETIYGTTDFTAFGIGS